MKISVVLVFFLFISTIVFGQSPILRGTVKDKKGIAVPGAGVYVSGYKIATVTDPDGNFEFKMLGPGNYDILVESIGFLPGKASVTLDNKEVKINITLEENTINIKQVVIMPDAVRQRYIALFKEFFIGHTPNSAKCKLINPDVLNINFDNNILTVTTTEFLVIENQALGYRLKYLLNDFEYNYNTHIVYYEGYPNFEDMPGSKSKQKKWAKAREVAYNGSLQHFYRSLYTNTSTREGYVINKRVDLPDRNRQPDSVIENNIMRLTKKQLTTVRNLIINGTDSLSYWIQMKRKPKTMAILRRDTILPDTLVHTYSADIKYINFTDDLYVIYSKEKEDDGYQDTGYWQSRPLDIPDIQISLIEIRKRPVGFYENGSLTDPASSLVSGYWAYQKIGDQVPLDYDPPLKK